MLRPHLDALGAVLALYRGRPSSTNENSLAAEDVLLMGNHISGVEDIGINFDVIRPGYGEAQA